MKAAISKYEAVQSGMKGAESMTMEKYQNLLEYLPGLTPEMGEAWEKLAEIFQYQVFELYSEEEGEQQKNYYIPYMMNDALECYLKFDNCRMTGSYLPGFQGEVHGELAGEGGRRALVVHQGDQVFTLWFEKLEMILKRYPYHEIGHFWVKGQEQWRQLVYMAGTIYDKYEYLGEQMLNEEERELTALMEFAPFRYWSPVKESLEGIYTDTERGAEYMKKLALEAKDRSFAGLISLYRKMPHPWLGRILAIRMNAPKRERLYRIIREKICEASRLYPPRDYGSKINQKISCRRSEVSRILRSKGFSGEYPLFRKKGMQVLAAEEHPFTILEAENFQFRIQFMVSTGKLSDKGINSGFFKGRNRMGRIEKNLDFLEENEHARTCTE